MQKKLGILIKRASRQPVIEGLTFIKENYLNQQKLVADNNKLNVDAVRFIKNHCNSKKIFTLGLKDVKTYIAASTLSHLLDGWGYLANSVNALLAGNKGVAIHLAYYSELRATMSFLAAEGIGVFDKQHLGLFDDGTFDFFNKPTITRRTTPRREVQQRHLPTHIFAWDALEKWCKSSARPPYNILQIFKVKGRDFSELTQGFHPSATTIVSTNITKRWLANWAFDVSKFRDDRELRNFVSYRPQTFAPFNNNIGIKDTITNIYSLLEVISPSERDTFYHLDRLLLKSLYNEIYTDRSLQTNNFEDLIENAFSHLGENLDLALKNLLLSPRNHLIFNEASKKELSPLPIIARALLLLRISTGIVSLLLRDANISKDDLRFLWDSYGLNNGFWSNSLPVDEFFNLWVELDNDYNNIVNNWDTIDDNQYSIINGTDINISRISQFNRAALWGL